MNQEVSEAPRCRLCDARLTALEAQRPGDPCTECRLHPDAQKPLQTRPFTVADKSLIKQVHRYMPPAQLLSVLNQRLVADLGEQTAPYSLAQLDREIQLHKTPTVAAGGDWASLRKVIGQARRSGVLARATPEVIADFAVVFSLSPAQELRLREVVTSAQTGAAE